MRKLFYVLLGLLIFAGAAGLLINRQLQVADDVTMSAPADPQSKPRARSFSRDGTGVSGGDVQPGARAQRRFDRGLGQYRTPAGGWNTFQAVLDVLNVVVGIAGIGLALTGVRLRRDSGASSRRDA